MLVLPSSGIARREARGAAARRQRGGRRQVGGRADARAAQSDGGRAVVGVAGHGQRASSAGGGRCERDRHRARGVDRERGTPTSNGAER